MSKTKNFLWHFTEQLALFYQSGIPLSQALNLLAQEQYPPQELEIFKSIERSVNRGQSLSVSLKRHPEIFPKFYLRLIELGELSGRLIEVLTELKKTLKTQMLLKRKVMHALFYPCVVLSINLLVVSALLWFVVPQYAVFFAKDLTTLPWLTLLLLNLSRELHYFWWFNVCVGALILFGLRHIFYHKNLRRKICNWAARSYGLKTLIKFHDLTLLCRSLALCLRAGLTLTQALELCAPLSLNPHYHEALQTAVRDISRGKNLLNALKKHHFPTLMLQFIKVGETTGQLDVQLVKIAEIYEAELTQLLNKIIALLEPAMMLCLGTLIGTIMYALYQPLLQLGTLI
jgi:type II secretory pathway component PulF